MPRTIDERDPPVQGLRGAPAPEGGDHDARTQAGCRRRGRARRAAAVPAGLGLARDPGRLGASLEAFAAHPACNVGELRQDLNRFTFLLGGDDGEALVGPDPAGEAP